MGSEENRAILRRVNEALNRQDLTILDEFIADNYVDHTNDMHGKEQVKRFYAGAFKDLPDFHRTIEDLIADGDKVWARFHIYGTAPTWKKIEMDTVSIIRFANGKATKAWAVPRVAGQDRSVDRSLYK
jgi:predicted ester cyclase